MMMIRVIPICFIDSLMRTFNTFRADEIEDEKYFFLVLKHLPRYILWKYEIKKSLSVNECS